ncbi:MAG: hypothetical protein JF616_08830 [Fibrobacteres bacterium]|nr:hypothetical protein [Fibrobacterota bacterium]
MRFVIPFPALICAIAFTSANAQTDSTDMRNQRKWAISAEIGMNSLSSLVGPVGTYYAMPSLAIDLGAGLSSSGLRPGLRARYLFTPKDKTSFYGGLGLKYGLGSGNQEVKVQDSDTKADLKLETKPTTFLDFMLGVEFLANNGFLVISNLGYSQLLSDKPYEITEGVASDKGKKVLDTVFGSGLMLSVSLGKAF